MSYSPTLLASSTHAGPQSTATASISECSGLGQGYLLQHVLSIGKVFGIASLHAKFSKT